MKTVEEIAREMRNSNAWNDVLNRELCEAAGMLPEYEAADGDTFEAVVFAAAEKLGVEII